MSCKVLVVDDSMVVYKMIKRFLEPTGFEVLGHAENGKICIEMYEELKPDIVTLDMTMPVMDGLEAATRLIQINPDIKIVLLSSIGDEDLINKAKEIGIKYFAQKPINAEELVNLLNLISAD